MGKLPEAVTTQTNHLKQVRCSPQEHLAPIEDAETVGHPEQFVLLFLRTGQPLIRLGLERFRRHFHDLNLCAVRVVGPEHEAL